MISKNMKRVFGAAALVLGAALGSGCNVDITPTLPAYNQSFNFLLPPGTPINGDLNLPPIDVCAVLSEEVILQQLQTAPGGALLASLFTNFVHIEEVSIVSIELTASDPLNATFDGITEFTFRTGNQTIVSGTDTDGIDGEVALLTTTTPFDLFSLIDSCPQDPASISVRIRGNVPDVPPSAWSTRIKLHIVARFGPI